MILGKLSGRYTTTKFTFIVDGDAQKFEYVQVYHPDYGYVLCQIVELIRDGEKITASCNVIGYKAEDGYIKPIRSTFLSNTEVLRAEDRFIKETVMMQNKENGAYIGLLEGKDIQVHLDLQKMLTKHVAILAKTGAGKSYTAAVLLEEIIEKGIPLLIIDPHGEYVTMKTPNEDKKELDLMPRFKIKAKGYVKNVVEYGNPATNPNVKPIRVSNKLSSQELLHLLPAKLTSTQKSIVYSALENVDDVSFTDLLFEIDKDESSSKYSLINVIKFLMNLDIFSAAPTPLNELVIQGRCSVLNLKGFNPELQEILVYKLLKDLFAKRKHNQIPPFFMIIEEAHNFCPERNFGERKSSGIIRTIAAEGRKFGLGLCVISQRPARVDNNVLSQCNTQIIMKVTNPSDLKAIVHSVEGITKESEEEIKNLPIGTAMVTGVTDTPLFVNIRPRKSQHGGSAASMFNELEQVKKFSTKQTAYTEENVLPIITPKMTKKDIKLMSQKPVESVQSILVPAAMAFCKGKTDFNLVVERINGKVLLNTDTMETGSLPDLSKLTANEMKVLKECYNKKEFMPSEIELPDLARIGNYLKLLQSKGYIILTGQKYTLNPKILLKDLSHYANYDSIQLIKLSYDKKIKPRFSLEDIKTKLSHFVNVEEVRECHLVQYKVTHKLI